MTVLQTFAKARRIRLQTHKLSQGDHEFLPAALEILDTPLSPIRTALSVTICAFALVALAWSYFGQIDIIAVAQGKIQPVGRTKIVQPLDTGKVLALHVSNGSRVHAGDVLINLDASEAKADESSLTVELQSLEGERNRRIAALDVAAKRAPETSPQLAWDADVPSSIRKREQRVLDGALGQLNATVASLSAQYEGKQAEGARLRDTIVAQDQLVGTLRERVDMRSTLLDKNAGSRAAVIDAQESLQKEGTTLAAQKGQIGEVAASLLLAQRDIDRTYSTFIADNADKLDEVDRRIDEDRQKLAKARIRTSEMTLKSPIDGIVIGLTVTSVGQVVTTGQQILQVVPHDSALEIEAYLPNGDIGFVKIDQTAVVKIESFPFTRYGTLVAHVTRVAEDAIPQADAELREGNPTSAAKDDMFGGSQRTQNLVYPVNLKLDKTVMDVDGRAIPLVPGMAVTVEIKTGTRRILEYLFSPVMQVATTAMKER